MIICEGVSDQTTLHKPTKNFISNKKINLITKITKGDICCKPESTYEGCVNEIKKIINFYKTQYGLLATDLFGAYHIVDTDGALSENDIYVQSKSGYYIKDGLIFTTNIAESKKINQTKRNILKKLYSMGKMCDIPYKVLFFSRNLEHDLYDKPVCTIEEKINLSDHFEEEYQSNSDLFYKKIEDSRNGVPINYKESWEYILDGNNSLNRGSNYVYLLNEIKNQKNN